MRDSDSTAPRNPPPGLVVLVNAISSLMGGVVTVAQELTAALAAARPGYRFVLCHANPEIGSADYPPNVERVHLPDLISKRRRWLWEQRRLPTLCRERDVDVVLHLGGYSCFALDRPQVSVWQNSTTFSPTGSPGPLSERIYRRIQRAAQTRSMTRSAANVFLTRTSVESASRFWDMSRIPHVVIHHGIDHKRLTVAEPPELDRREALALSVGHAFFHKNYENLIDAMAVYRERHGEGLRLEIIGGGGYAPAYFEKLRSRIHDRELGTTVTMLGQTSPEVVLERLAAARVYVVTSLLESFGLTLLEAMGAGVPVVASNATCHPEVAQQAALYCDPLDPADIAEKLHRALTEPDLCRELQMRGIARVREFSWDTSAERYLKLLDQVVDGAGPCGEAK